MCFLEGLYCRRESLIITLTGGIVGERHGGAEESFGIFRSRNFSSNTVSFTDGRLVPSPSG